MKIGRCTKRKTKEREQKKNDNDIKFSKLILKMIHELSGQRVRETARTATEYSQGDKISFLWV